jgi:hypothetical protein
VSQSSVAASAGSQRRIGQRTRTRESSVIGSVDENEIVDVIACALGFADYGLGSTWWMGAPARKAGAVDGCFCWGGRQCAAA